MENYKKKNGIPEEELKSEKDEIKLEDLTSKLQQKSKKVNASKDRQITRQSRCRDGEDRRRSIAKFYPNETELRQELQIVANLNHAR